MIQLSWQSVFSQVQQHLPKNSYLCFWSTFHLSAVGDQYYYCWWHHGRSSHSARNRSISERRISLFPEPAGVNRAEWRRPEYIHRSIVLRETCSTFAASVGDSKPGTPSRSLLMVCVLSAFFIFFSFIIRCLIAYFPQDYGARNNSGSSFKNYLTPPLYHPFDPITVW